MQLSPGERSILAYFPSREKALQASRDIQTANLVSDLGSIQVDGVHRYSAAVLDNGYDSPINKAATLSGVTIYSSESGPEGPDPLLAADPSASGYDSPHGVTPQGKSILLTVVLNQDDVPRAVELIKKHGGTV